MKRNVLIIICIIAVSAFFAWRFFGGESDVSTDKWGIVGFGEGMSTSTVISTDGWKEYVSPNFSFALKYPPQFNVAEMDDFGSTVLVFQNPSLHQGFQIYVSAIDETFDMTRERILQDIPDMEIRDPQPVLLGEDAGQGLAFMSNTEAFGGDSREVWFVFNDTLYQISTYASLDTLLQKVMGTWEFR